MLAGKFAVVTGASKGIGMAVTKALVQKGACVVAGALTVDSLVNLDGVTAVALDLSDPAAPAALVQRALDEHGTIDVLVNNVGAVRLRLDGFLAVTDDDFVIRPGQYSDATAQGVWIWRASHGQLCHNASPKRPAQGIGARPSPPRHDRKPTAVG